MPNGVDILKAKLKPVFKNLFRVSIQFPTFLGGQLATEQIEFLCQGAAIPSGTTGTIEIPFKGTMLKLAGDNTYSDWTVSILNNQDFNIYKTIQRWRSFQKSDALGTKSNDLSYKSVATIEQLDGDENVIYTCSLIGLFPSTVAELTRGQGENDSVDIFDATFVYDMIVGDNV